MDSGREAPAGWTCYHCIAAPPKTSSEEIPRDGEIQAYVPARPQRPHSGPQVDPGTSDRGGGGQQKSGAALNASRKFRSSPGLVSLGNTWFIKSLGQCLLANKSLPSITPSCVGNTLTLARNLCFATFAGAGGGVRPPLAFPNEAS